MSRLLSPKTLISEWDLRDFSMIVPKYRCSAIIEIPAPATNVLAALLCTEITGGPQVRWDLFEALVAGLP